MKFGVQGNPHGKSALALILCLLFALSPFASAQETSSTSPAVADDSQMTAVEDVVEEGMTPLYADSLNDGEYSVQVESSSSMFRITECRLRVENGAMEATLVMGGTGYLYVFPGTALEAASAEESAFIPYTEDAEGRHCFTIPAGALDAPVPCAAFSKNKELWYDRMLLFRADSLPLSAFRPGVLATAKSLELEDGVYTVEVSLSGGSGRARISSPARLTVEGGVCTARIQWGSKNYDYMKIGEEQFFPVEGEELSTFDIPVPYFDRSLAVIADTVAMSEPHEIAYSLLFSSGTIQKENGEVLPLQYAERFHVERISDSALLLTLGEGDKFVLVSRDAPVPEDLPAGVPVIPIPADNIYVASSSVPDLFSHCGALPAIRFTSTDEASWKLPAVLDAMEREELLYAGKYSAPDYELLLEEGCSLAIENTMILHNPKVKEKLESLGIPVLIEYSSYEPHPLGRVEWIRLWGLLSGRQEEAEEFFARQEETFEAASSGEPTGKTVAFFHVTSAGAIGVRKSADYVTRMITLAGGSTPSYALPEDDTALSTATIQMEAFYAAARDADVLIYNSAVAGEISTMEDLLAKSSLFSDFKAVKNGAVWCTEQSVFQESSAAAGMIADLHLILSGEADGQDVLMYFHRVK